MDKEVLLREVKYLRNKQAMYGWREEDYKRMEELKKMWDSFAHIENGKYVKAPPLY